MESNKSLVLFVPKMIPCPQFCFIIGVWMVWGLWYGMASVEGSVMRQLALV